MFINTFFRCSDSINILSSVNNNRTRLRDSYGSWPFVRFRNVIYLDESDWSREWDSSIRRISRKAEYYILKILVSLYYRPSARRNKMRSSSRILDCDNVSKRSLERRRNCEDSISDMFWNDELTSMLWNNKLAASIVDSSLTTCSRSNSIIETISSSSTCDNTSLY